MVECAVDQVAWGGVGEWVKIKNEEKIYFIKLERTDFCFKMHYKVENKFLFTAWY